MNHRHFDRTRIPAEGYPAGSFLLTEMNPSLARSFAKQKLDSVSPKTNIRPFVLVRSAAKDLQSPLIYAITKVLFYVVCFRQLALTTRSNGIRGQAGYQGLGMRICISYHGVFNSNAIKHKSMRKAKKDSTPNNRNVVLRSF